MNEWKKVKLGEIAETIQTGPFGSQLHQSDYSIDGTPVVMPKDIINGTIDDSSIARVNQEHVQRLSRHKVNVGDILYARRGDVGKCAYVDNNEKGWLCGTGCLKVRIDPNKASSKFVFFELQKQSTIAWVKLHAKGATMPNLNTEILGEVPLEIPNIKIQNRIVDTLSRYDSLIENYQQQIKLLEEAAQRIYKEWFVDLKFPRHEKVKIVDGVPEGWENLPVDSIYTFKYGKNLSTKEIKASGIYPVYGANGVIGYYDIPNCNCEIVLITSRGNGSGDVHRTTQSYSFITNNSFMVIPNEAYSYCELPFTYFFMKQANFKLVRTGAAQPQLTNSSINTVHVLLPEKDSIISFCNSVEPIFKKIDLLIEQIRLLTEARDRLLPKLMSGEIAV